ncbi:hypothetical protein BpHYR1_014733 [Brachionus plicatilis]|uniref:Uncharacterized protein n=1 Tax=Brachionus plicatilis TaxID=10195 RepID=A0A3M7T7B2_BRAPC|nr:hypothetical protein BpHYR1_014733 [Brachionus plicatilis]
MSKTCSTLTLTPSGRKMLYNVVKCKVMEFSKFGKNHFAESELLMGDFGSRGTLAFVDIEKDLENVEILILYKTICNKFFSYELKKKELGDNLFFCNNA